MSPNFKPVGGVESVALYPANAVTAILFSSEGCEVSLSGSSIAVELEDDMSHYEEQLESRHGVIRIHHKLTLISNRDRAAKWLTAEFLEQASIEGVIAVVTLCDGRRLLVGYSSNFGEEQPLRLSSLISSSGSKLRENPTVTLQLVSCDTEFSQRIL